MQQTDEFVLRDLLYGEHWAICLYIIELGKSDRLISRCKLQLIYNVVKGTSLKFNFREHMILAYLTSCFNYWIGDCEAEDISYAIENLVLISREEYDRY